MKITYFTCSIILRGFDHLLQHVLDLPLGHGVDHLLQFPWLMELGTNSTS